MTFKHLILLSHIITAAIARGGGRIIISLPPRHGKQLSHDTPILTPGGWRTHGDLRPGDYVFGRKGQPVMVQGISEETIGEYEVEFSDGEVIHCHENHEWVIYNRHNHKEQIISTGDLIKLPLRNGTERKRGNRYHYQVDHNVCVEFPERDLLLHPYFFGAWLGDGTTTKGCITYAEPDRAVLDKIISLGYQVSSHHIHKTTGVLTDYIKDSAPALKKLGVLGNKFIPDEYLFSSVAQRKELLAGLIDTDGSLDKKGRVRIVTSSLVLASQIQQLVRSLGSYAYIMSQQPSVSTSGIVGKKIIYSVGFNFPDCLPTAIKRKSTGGIKQKIIKRSIIAVRKVAGKPGRCIQVEGGVYLAGETLIPTHNSWFLSQWLPAWFLSMWPDKKVILSTYEANFAATWGRRVRNIIKQDGHRVGVFLAEDATASNNWETQQGGGMMTAGIGGPITGKGFHLGLIDDAHKNWQEAQSSTIRNMIKDWFDSTFYTRAEPGATIVVLMCMIGDTRVLMADGSEKKIRDIKIGNEVISYQGGKVITAKIVNWANQGVDDVFTIKTRSGITVTANERHPFLVSKNGETKWIRLRELKVGDAVVRVLKNGEDGMECRALPLIAKNQQNAKDSANITTDNGDGTMVLDHHQPIQEIGAIPVSKQDMALELKNTTHSLQNRMDDVQYVENHQERTYVLTGTENSVSIIAMIPEKSEDYYVTTVTSQSDTERQKLSCSPRLNIYEIIPDEIMEITPAGREDVFDIQVEATENFIANGLVSHNTRWHEDDLIGYLMREKHDDGWVHVRIPAIAEDWNGEEDVLGRQVGEALCPERYDITALNRIKANMTPMMWNALFQQRPAPMEGSIFLRKNWKYYKIPPTCNFILQSWDTASKKNLDSAYSVCTTWGVSDVGAIMLDRWRERVEFPQLRREVSVQYMKWQPNVILIEDRDSGQALIQQLQQETTYPVLPIYPDLDKVIRAQAVSPMQESGRVWLPDPSCQFDGREWVGEFIDICATFPNTLYKDDIDSMSQALAYIMTMSMSGSILSCERRRTSKLLENFRSMM